MDLIALRARLSRLPATQLLVGLAGLGYAGVLIIQALLNVAILGRPVPAHETSWWMQAVLGLGWPLGWAGVGLLALLKPDRIRVGIRWVLGFLVCYLAYALVSEDATAGGQFVLLLPVLIGSLILSPGRAWIACAGACLASTVVSLTLLNRDFGILSIIVVTPACVATTATVLNLLQWHRRTESRLRDLAENDHLTGLSTRRVLERRAAEGMSSITGDRGTGLLLLDLDHFKAVNDTHGHPSGDALLRHIAQILQSQSRPTDIACRLGGDEMALLILDVTLDEARSVANRVCETIRAGSCQLPGGIVVTPQVSAGLGFLTAQALTTARTGTQATDVEQLYALADSHLYHAKRHCRGQLVGA